MAKKKTIYRPFKEFDNFFERCIEDEQSFELHTTGYTKKVIFDGYSVLFNETGTSDERLLHLINMVRSDAKKYLDKNDVKEPESIKFFDLTDKPPTTLVTKVDISSAYWTTAQQLGVISDKTHETLYKYYDNNKELKSARLKALGSLATKKIVHVYANGEWVSSMPNIQPTRDLYMHICGKVDDCMQDIGYNMNGVFYYYWDCLFCEKRTTREVVDAVAKYDYSSKVQETSISVLKIGRNNYLMSKYDKKMYLIPEDSAGLLYAS